MEEELAKYIRTGASRMQESVTEEDIAALSQAIKNLLPPNYPNNVQELMKENLWNPDTKILHYNAPTIQKYIQNGMEDRNPITIHRPLRISQLSKEVEYGCQRHLYKFLQTKETPRSAPKNEQVHQHTTRGNVFEQKVLQWLQSKYPDSVLDATDVELASVMEQTSNKLKKNKEVFIYQLKLHPKMELFSPELAARGVTLRAFIPDLLHIQKDNNGINCSVIDIKSSSHVKPSHQLQIAGYAIVLSDVQDKWNVVNGEVWLPTDPHDRLSLRDAPRKYPFSLSLLKPFVLKIFHEIHQIFSQEKPLQWSLSSRCVGCQFMSECRAEAKETGSAEVLCGLSRGNRKSVKDYMQDHGISDIEDFYKNYSSKRPSNAHLQHLLGDNGKESLLMKAFETNEIIPRPSKSQLLPKTPPTTCVFISLNWNNATDQLENIYIGINDTPYGPLNKTEFVQKLAQFIDEFDKAGNLTVQFFVLDGEQHHQLMQLLLQCIQDEALELFAQKVLVAIADDPIYFMRDLKDELQGTTMVGESVSKQRKSELESLYRYLRRADPPKLLVAELRKEIQALLAEHRKAVVTTPPRTVVLLEAARSLLILPLIGLATDEELVALLTDNKIHQDTSKLTVMKSVHEALRKFAAANLITELQPFRYWQDTRLNNPILRSLLFVRQHERYVELQQMRMARLHNTRALHVRVTKVMKGEAQAQIIDGVDLISSSVNEQGLGGFICYPADSDVALEFSDLEFCNKFKVFLPKSLQDKGLSIVDVAAEGDLQHMSIKILPLSGKLKPNQEYKLRPRYIDFLLPKVAQTLHDLDNDPENEFIRLFTAPHQTCDFKKPDHLDYQTLVDKETLRLRFGDSRQLFPSKSQQEAYRHACKNRVQLLWGPPGTGKTTYLSLTLLRWAQAAICNGEQLRVLITAFTKTAIHELLSSFHDRYQLWTNGSKEFKPSGWPEFNKMCCVVVSDSNDKTYEGAPYGVVKLSSKKSDTALPDTQIQIIAGTVHQLFKLRNKYSCDVLIIDESSQLLLPEAIIPMSMMKPKTSKLLLGGDHLQLPPLLKAKYPVPHSGQPELATSVLQAFLRASMDNKEVDFLDANLFCPVLQQLKENQRSNEEIGRFIKQLYQRGYDLPKRRRNQLMLRPRSEALAECKLLGNILKSHAEKDPYSLVMIEVTIDGTLTAERERQLEGQLVKKLVEEIRSACPKSQCFVPTPHRAQRYFITAALDKLMDQVIDGDRAVQVDTVDRMQGRQADCVLISALLSDPDVISSEAEFLFSLNRLNVAMSRAKALCILLTSSTLLDPSPEVLRSQSARAGYERVVSFQAAARAQIHINAKLNTNSISLSAFWNKKELLCKWEA